MKKTIFLIFLLGASIFIRAQLVNSEITVSDANINVGCNFEITISTSELLEEWGITAYQFNLNFDSSIVEYNGYDISGTLSEGGIVAVNNNNDSIRVAYMTTAALNGDGILIKLEFVASNIGITDLNIYDFIYNTIILDNLNNGIVRITNEPHFIPIWSGENSYLPMNIDIHNAKIDGINMTTEDEIGVFDDDVCVGAIRLTEEIDSLVTIIASTDNPNTEEIIDGFISGDQISFKLWDCNREIQISSPEINIIDGNDIFLSLSSSSFELYGFTSSELNSPDNVTVSIIRDSVFISWDKVEEANSYSIYASDNPYGTFVDVTSQGSFGSERQNLEQLTNLGCKRLINCTNQLLFSACYYNKSKQFTLGKTRIRQTWVTDIGGIEKKFYYVKAVN